MKQRRAKNLQLRCPRIPCSWGSVVARVSSSPHSSGSTRSGCRPACTCGQWGDASRWGKSGNDGLPAPHRLLL